MKLINGAVITKCGECDRYLGGVCTRTGKDIDLNKIDTIDPSCPLQDVEVIECDEAWISHLPKGIKNPSLTDVSECINYKDIDHIIIVRKKEVKE